MTDEPDWLVREAEDLRVREELARERIVCDAQVRQTVDAFRRYVETLERIVQPHEGYCCRMRARFVLVIGGINTNYPEPAEVADFVTEWHPRILLSTRYCALCGQSLPGDAPRQVVPPREVNDG